MPNTFYFSHDYSARSDEKIKRLLRQHGLEGYGLFWAIVEDLYNNANAMRTDYEGIAHDLHCDENLVKSVIEDFDLFKISQNNFSSPSVGRRLRERKQKSVKASESAKKRWNKDYANAMRTQCDGNAIKESKGKENKGKESIDANTVFECMVRASVGKEVSNDFLWQESKKLIEKYKNTGTPKLQGLVNKWVSNLQLKDKNRHISLNSFI